MTKTERLNRREFLATAGAAAAAVTGLSACKMFENRNEPGPEIIFDIHQHTHYHGRSDDDLISHQRAMGVTKTVLLPAGSKYGLAADCGRNDTVLAMTQRLPNEFVYFANELPDIDEAREEIEKYVGLGAIGIGEQKFPVECDSVHIEKVATIAREHDVPILLHFQHESYNYHLENFHRILEKFPEVDFIGHAQTFWGHIDKNHEPKDMYPESKVTAGGLTDRLLRDYPNMYGDLSAGSGLNSLLRDEEHAAGFLLRHQNKLMYGSDCADIEGQGEACQGARTIATIRRLVPAGAARRKIFSENAARVIGL